jgi:hypothetical protein
MAITAIRRDEAYSPFIVRIISSDDLAAVGTAGYLTAQHANIVALNEGDWQWEVSDMVLVYASDGWGFFQIDPGFASLVPFVFGGSVVGAPVTIGDFAVFQSTSGNLEDLGYLPSDASKTRVVMAGSAVVVNHAAKFVDTTGTIDDTAGALINSGNIQAGLSGTAGTLISFPSSAANGSFIWAAVGNAGNFNATVSPKSTLGQSSVYTIPDPGAATANFVLDAGTAAAISVNNLKYGATPVAQVDPGSCTISGAAGASNVCTVTVQLKDGSGTNMARIIPFRIYASSAADGLTLASAASTGFAVVSGGLSLQNGAAVTTQISAMSSATGGCVLSLTDTAKQTSYLVLVLANGCKISAQLSSGSYGA